MKINIMYLRNSEMIFFYFASKFHCSIYIKYIFQSHQNTLELVSYLKLLRILSTTLKNV